MSPVTEPTTATLHMLSKAIHPGDNQYRRAIDALARLETDPDRLERERERKFTRPPRVPSAATTEFDETEPTEEERERDRLFALESSLRFERCQSYPEDQFGHQYEDLASELDTLEYRGQYRCPRKFDGSRLKHARFLVKMRWIQQGIWKDEWNAKNRPTGDWKHTGPLPPPPESESDDEPDNPPPMVEPPLMAKPESTATSRPIVWGLFSGSLSSDNQPGGLFPGSLLSDNHGFLHPMPPKEASPRIRPFRDGPAEPLDRAASRPFHQFMAQLSYQREKVVRELDEPPSDQRSRKWRYYDKDLGERCQAARDQWLSDRPADDDPARIPPDINTIAYARLRALWKKWMIWDDRWGVLPGMSWKHEYPLEKMLEERAQAAMGKGPAKDNPDPFRPGWLEETGRNLRGEELVVARYGPLFSLAYELETYGAKMAERGIALDDSDDSESLEPPGNKVYFGAASPQQPATPAKPSAPSTSPPAPDAQEAGAGPATAEPVPENSQPTSPSPPVRQKQRRGRATRSGPRENLGVAALKPLSPGRVSKTRKPTRPGGSKQLGSSGVPVVNGTVTPRRRSQRLQLASEERPAVEAREDTGRSAPVRRSTRSTVGTGAGLGKKPAGVTKRGPSKSRGKRG